jgi:AcrR family transcriptional regulator
MNAAPIKPRPEPEKLPNRWEGRHGLSGAEVEEHQRRRLYDAVAIAVSEKGYADASVQDFLEAAGISRQTFYKQFSNKDAAYLEAFDYITGDLMKRVGAAFDHSTDFVTGTIACLREFLNLAVEKPEYAVMCIVEVKAAGPAAIKRRDELIQGLASLLLFGAERYLGGALPPHLVAVGSIGGVHEVVYSYIAQGKVTRLPEVLPELAYLLWVPFIGPEAARDSMETLRATG